MISFPISLGIAAISNQFIPAFFGDGYEKSALLLKILCVNVLSVAISNFIAQQCLIARSKQKEYNISVSLSAGVNILLNFFLVNRFLSIGVSVASVISGILILILVIMFSRDVLSFVVLIKMSWKYITCSIIMICSVLFVNVSSNSWLDIFTKVITGIFVYPLW